MLKTNITLTLQAIHANIEKSQSSVNDRKQEQMKYNKAFNENILAEKDHFLRLKEYEDEMDRNDELNAKMKKYLKAQGK